MLKENRRLVLKLIMSFTFFIVNIIKHVKENKQIKIKNNELLKYFLFHNLKISSHMLYIFILPTSIKTPAQNISYF